MSLILTTKRLFQTFPVVYDWSNCNIKFGREMPKKSTAGAGKEQNTKQGKLASSSPAPALTGPIKVTKDGDLAISIQVKPGAKINAITGVSEEAVSVQISAPPVDGEANTAIVKYFAEVLNLKKTDVSLKVSVNAFQGGKSRQKTVTINSSTGLSIESVLKSLRTQQGK